MALVADFSADLARELVNHVYKVIAILIPAFKQDAAELITVAIFNDARTNLIINNTRMIGELGLRNSFQAVEDVVDAMIEGMEVIPLPVSGTGLSLQTGIRTSFFRTDLQDVLSSPTASFISEVLKVSVDWLDWLLTKGQEQVVRDYIFLPNDAGRTGYGNMRKAPGLGWEVPAQLSGTASNNWLTDALRGAEGALIQKMSNRLEAAL